MTTKPSAAMTRRFIILLFAIVSLAFQVAADWPQFRGPAGNGLSLETGLPTSLEASRDLAWKIPLPGRGLSSPIVVGDRIFVTSSSGPKQERLHVLCFNGADGSLRWERVFWATARTMCHEKTAVAAPTPASDGRHVFALFSCNDVVCLDLEGNLVWLRGLTRDYPNASNSLGMSSSPVVADGALVVQIETDSESFAAGLDTLTGTNRWRMDRPKKANWTSPLLFAASDGRPLALLQSSAGLHAVEPGTGRLAWSYTDGASTIPSSTRSGNVFYVPSHGLTALQPDAESPTPKQLWRSNQLQPATASPLVVGTNVFTLNGAGVLTCGDIATGKRSWQLRLKGPFSATPVSAEGRLYLVSEKGILQIVEPVPPEGQVTGELDLKETILATPSISGGALYVRSDRHLWKFRKG